MSSAPTGERRRPGIALATVEEGWAADDDAPLLVEALEAAGADATPAMWDDPSVDWARFDLVVIRSTWDYARRPDDFAEWAERVESVTRLANPARVVRWNIDKHYLGALAGAGVAVVPTTYLEPGATAAAVVGALPVGHEVVVKPTVSAGSKDTARHGAGSHDAAAEHAASLLAAGRAVMVQPYLSAVDRIGETGMVFFEDRFSHAFRKGQLLHPDAAPAEGLFAEESITARTPPDDELRLALDVLAAADRILSTGPLPYARVDVVRDDADRPVLLELELVEPSFFLAADPSSAERAAGTFVRLARAAASGRSSGPRG